MDRQRGGLFDANGTHNVMAMSSVDVLAILSFI